MLSKKLQLVCMRHAEASNDSILDKSRRISANGLLQLKKLQEIFSKTSDNHDLFLISDSKRTIESYKNIFGEKYLDKTKFLPELYLADSMEIKRIINAHANSISCIFVLAHNPGVSSLVSELTGDYFNFSPAEYVCIGYEKDDWSVALSMESCWRICEKR